MNTQRGFRNRLHWMQDAYQLTPTDRVLQKTPFSFDVSVWEFFWPIVTGATLVMARPGEHRDSAYLVRVIDEQGITTIHFVPSMLAAFLHDPEVAQCHNLRRVICSGEALSFRAAATVFRLLLPDVELHNLYGPTEAAVDVSFWACQPDLRKVGLCRSVGRSPTCSFSSWTSSWSSISQPSYRASFLYRGRGSWAGVFQPTGTDGGAVHSPSFQFAARGQALPDGRPVSLPARRNHRISGPPG